MYVYLYAYYTQKLKLNFIYYVVALSAIGADFVLDEFQVPEISFQVCFFSPPAHFRAVARIFHVEIPDFNFFARSAAQQ